MIPDLASQGVRLTLDAEELLGTKVREDTLQKILLLKKPLVSKEDIEAILNPKEAEPQKTEIVRPSDFVPVAKDHSPDIKILPYVGCHGEIQDEG